jgi:hypothetical protein
LINNPVGLVSTVASTGEFLSEMLNGFAGVWRRRAQPLRSRSSPHRLRFVAVCARWTQQDKGFEMHRRQWAWPGAWTAIGFL